MECAGNSERHNDRVDRCAANDFQLVERLLPRLRSSAWVSQSLRIRKHGLQYSRYAIEAATKFPPIASCIGRNKETLAEVVNYR